MEHRINLLYGTKDHFNNKNNLTYSERKLTRMDRSPLVHSHCGIILIKVGHENRLLTKCGTKVAWTVTLNCGVGYNNEQ